MEIHEELSKNNAQSDGGEPGEWRKCIQKQLPDMAFVYTTGHQLAW